MTRVQAEGFDYQAEADATCSIVWNPQNVDYDAFLRTCRAFAELGELMNLYKKLLFRGKMPGDLGMKAPDHFASLDGNGGHIRGFDVDLVHGIVGYATESAEAVEILIDMLIGKAPDRINVIEEAGDGRWYINRMLRWANCTDLQCERANIDKLHGRGHANGLDVFADANRDLTAERNRLVTAIDGDAPCLPLGPHGDEETRFAKTPIGDCEGMDC